MIAAKSAWGVMRMTTGAAIAIFAGTKFAKEEPPQTTITSFVQNGNSRSRMKGMLSLRIVRKGAD